MCVCVCVHLPRCWSPHQTKRSVPTIFLLPPASTHADATSAAAPTHSASGGSSTSKSPGTPSSRAHATAPASTNPSLSSPTAAGAGAGTVITFRRAVDLAAVPTFAALVCMLRGIAAAPQVLGPSMPQPGMPGPRGIVATSPTYAQLKALSVELLDRGGKVLLATTPACMSGEDVGSDAWLTACRYVHKITVR